MTMELKQITHVENVRLSDDGRAVRILDQSRLPMKTVYLELSRAEELYEAIASLRVRGRRPLASLPATPCMFWPCRAKLTITALFSRSASATGTTLTAPVPQR